MSLLPFNASKLEKSLEVALTYNVDPAIISGYKYKIADPNNAIKVALAWEYSLSYVSVDNWHERIQQGLTFNRYKGTPYSLKLALGWYGLTDITIEEEVYGEHFAEFQIGFKEIPGDFETNTIINVANLAAPARSRLTRMYNPEYDVRRFVLDYSDWGDLLSDHSGHYIYDGSPKLSFGRKRSMAAEYQGLSPTFHNLRFHWNLLSYEDRFLLDFGYLDDKNVYALNYGMTSYPLRYIYNYDYIGDKIPDVLFDSETQAKAAIVLSDYILDDLNTCFSGSYTQLNDKTFELSYSFLSDNKIESENVFIDERFYRSKPADRALYDHSLAYTSGSQHFREYMSIMINLGSRAEMSALQELNASVLYKGNTTWHDHRHFNTSWSSQATYTEMV